MSFKDLSLSVGLSRPLVPIPNAPGFSYKTLALYKSLTHLLTNLLTKKSITYIIVTITLLCLL